jgi:hypothetical protein
VIGLDSEGSSMLRRFACIDESGLRAEKDGVQARLAVFDARCGCLQEIAAVHRIHRLSQHNSLTPVIQETLLDADQALGINLWKRPLFVYMWLRHSEGHIWVLSCGFRNVRLWKEGPALGVIGSLCRLLVAERFPL